MYIRFKKFLILFISVILLSIIASHIDDWLLTLDSNKRSQKENIDKLNDVIGYINNAYVEDIDWNNTIEGAVVGILQTLDPHSTYINKEEAELNEENFEGRYYGIGIYFDVIDDFPTVISVIPGSPSEDAGLESGDRIIKIDNESAYKLSMADVPKKLKGPKGTSVIVTISRGGIDEPFEISLIRGEIPIYTINTYFMQDKKTGYVWVNRFAQNTYLELNDALENLESQGMEQLILDLRGNGGGLLNEAVKMVSLFITGHKKVVYTKGRFSRYDEVYYTDDFELSKTRDFPLIILIDNGSASASEIVAGAIQDYDRGLIVGENSFGKGLVQNEFVLNDQSRIRLTVSKYYTPSGRLIQKPYKNKNIVDYFNGSVSDEESDINTLKANNSIDSLDVKPVYYTEHGREVYGGGGITPDERIEFIPYSNSSKMTRQFLQKRVFFEFASKLKNNKFKSMEDFSIFNKKFSLSENDFLELQKYARKKGIKFTNKEFNDDREYITNRVKAAISRNKWGMKYYYQVILQIDNQFLSSLKLFPQAMNLHSVTSLNNTQN